MSVAVTTDVLSERARTALDELIALPRIQGYGSYKGARGRCFEASLSAAYWFRAHKVPVRIVRFTNPRVVTPFSRDVLRELGDWATIRRVEFASGIVTSLNGSELYHLGRLEQHAVEVEGELLLDLTWRSWEPESVFPRIATVEEYALDFTVDETICPRCAARPEASEPCSHHSPVVEGAFVRWLRTDADEGILGPWVVRSQSC